MGKQGLFIPKGGYKLLIERIYLKIGILTPFNIILENLIYEIMGNN